MVTTVPETELPLIMQIGPLIAPASDGYLSNLESECEIIIKMVREERARRDECKPQPWDKDGPVLREESSLAQHCYQVTVPCELIDQARDGEEAVYQNAHTLYISEPYSLDDQAIGDLAQLQKDWSITLDAAMSRHCPGHTMCVCFRRRYPETEERVD